MDGEDDRLFQEEMAMREAGATGPEIALRLYRCAGVTKALRLRLYEEEERIAQFSYVFKNLPWLSEYDTTAHVIDIGAEHRIRRFFDSIKGFYKGSLDLLGRFQHRYESLNQRWIDLRSDLVAFRATLSLSDEITYFYGLDSDIGPRCGRSGEAVNSVVDRICIRWHINSSAQMSLMLQLSDEVARYLKAYPGPRFQTRRLQDLPLELIMYIMKQDIDSSRHLGATCHYFRGISAQYNYQSWSLLVSRQSVEWMTISNLVDSDDPLALGTFMRDRMAPECIRCREKYLHTVSQANLLSSIRHIHIGCSWLETHLTAAQLTDTDSRPYISLLDAITLDVVLQATGIRTLHLEGTRISTQSMTAVLDLPRLHTLELTDCELDSLPTNGVLCNSVLNVMLRIRPIRDFDIINLVRLCPQAKTLHLYFRLRDDSEDLTLLPIHEGCFRSLERLYLYHISPDGLDKFISHIAEAKYVGSPVRLTHFKLEVKWRLDRPQFSDLVESLSGNSLQYFVLDGTPYAGLDIFDQLARAFPELLSLVLVYRPNEPHVSKHLQWPHTSWEYAARLRKFKKLVHLGWNIAIDRPLAFQLPMLDFENDYSQVEVDNGSFPILHDPQDFLGDWDSVAKVLGAHCPTLKYLSTACDISMPFQYQIVHEEGRLRVVLLERTDVAQKELQTYNPEIRESKWLIAP